MWQWMVLMKLMMLSIASREEALAKHRRRLLLKMPTSFIVIADFRKKSSRLGQQWKKGVPAEVIPMAYKAVMLRLEKMNGKPTLRMAVKKAGPVITDNGNFVIDVDFGEIPVEKVKEINNQLLQIAGVVETGLFVEMAQMAYFGEEDGSISCRKAKNN
eukprot:TRINITY_DN617_c0_g2_i2.p1 TRINITY_DN617_c0_g2~~TRINITY_DN617_c0_g2_i2.p1  ORF type:complete len:158 (-),score=49.07 TRINITY_DN617_c0_g2_i2:227-700(-)